MFLSRTITAPTLARVHVDRSATCRVIVMKYWSQLGRLLIETSRKDADRLGYEREHQEYQAGDGAHQPDAVEWDVVVDGGGGSEPRHERDHRSPEEPARPYPEAEPDEGRREPARQERRAATDGGVGHVPTVELA